MKKSFPVSAGRSASTFCVDAGCVVCGGIGSSFYFTLFPAVVLGEVSHKFDFLLYSPSMFCFLFFRAVFPLAFQEYCFLFSFTCTCSAFALDFSAALFLAAGNLNQLSIDRFVAWKPRYNSRFRRNLETPTVW